MRLVLWFKNDSAKPIYTYDTRGKHWCLEIHDLFHFCVLLLGLKFVPFKLLLQILKIRLRFISCNISKCQQKAYQSAWNATILSRMVKFYHYEVHFHILWLCEGKGKGLNAWDILSWHDFSCWCCASYTNEKGTQKSEPGNTFLLSYLWNAIFLLSYLWNTIFLLSYLWKMV